MWFTLIVIFSTFSTPILAGPVDTAQSMLNQLGYSAGEVDGIYGGKTRRALEKFYTSKGKRFDRALDERELEDLLSALGNSSTPKSQIKKSRHLQHTRYADHIATPFRKLKVTNDFALIDDFNSFMEFHYTKVAGLLPDSKGKFRYQVAKNMDVNFCVNDFINTTTTKSDLSGSRGVQDVGYRCGNMLSQRFLNNPKKGVENYKRIILGWLDNGIIETANQFGRKLPQRYMETWPYAISSNVPNIITHYAIYHKSYNFDYETHQRVLKLGETFYTSFDCYPLLGRRGHYFQKLCNLLSQSKIVIGANDHCGSFSWRMATGGLYFGLEFGSQASFDTGVRHLEIMLATFNNEAVYLAQAPRGICAIGYMKQFAPHFELIDYVLKKAYGIDFINTKNINGVAPAQAYTKTWEIAHNPLQIVKYWNGFDQMNCSNNGKSMRQMIKQLKNQPNTYRDFWSGFNKEDFVLSAPSLASQELTGEWMSFHKSKVKSGN